MEEKPHYPSAIYVMRGIALGVAIAIAVQQYLSDALFINTLIIIIFILLSILIGRKKTN